MPVLGFNVFNPDKHTITEFKKIELQAYASYMYFISAVRRLLMTIVAITQIDVAMYSVIIKEIVSAITIRILLNEKKFTLDGDVDDSLENELLVARVDTQVDT